MEWKRKIGELFYKLTPEQKEQFKQYIPTKVYYTERNISIVVALIQLSMIIVFLVNKRLSVHNPRYIAFFSLYVFLLVVTCISLVSYRYTVRKRKYRVFFLLRRTYAIMLCIWVMGITYLELEGGKGLSSYYYLIPTTAAMLLLNPFESIAIFGGAWVVLSCIILNSGAASETAFGNLTNSIFVTVLSLFISYRYYKSTVTEFCDRELIHKQYEEIEDKNNLLLGLVQEDQLTCLYNRHYLTNQLYPLFEECKKEEYHGMFLMVDIDFFKQYNDLYGHLQGDECLKIIASTLSAVCQSYGASAIRYGGEEFLVTKICQSAFDPKTIAQKVFEAIKEKHLARSDVELQYVTVSIGGWYGSLNRIETIEHAIQYADEALYEAKSNGRNCSVFSKKSDSPVQK